MLVTAFCSPGKYRLFRKLKAWYSWVHPTSLCHRLFFHYNWSQKLCSYPPTIQSTRSMSSRWNLSWTAVKFQMAQGSFFYLQQPFVIFKVFSGTGPLHVPLAAGYCHVAKLNSIFKTACRVYSTNWLMKTQWNPFPYLRGPVLMKSGPKRLERLIRNFRFAGSCSKIVRKWSYPCWPSLPSQNYVGCIWHIYTRFMHQSKCIFSNGIIKCSQP